MRIEEIIKSSIEVKELILNDSELLSKVEKAAELITETYKQGGRVYFCGNDVLHVNFHTFSCDNIVIMTRMSCHFVD